MLNIRQKVKVDYGMKETDPLKYQYFYTKDEPDKPVKLKKEEVIKCLSVNIAGVN